MDTSNLNDALQKMSTTQKMTSSMARQHYNGREIKLYGDPGTKFEGKQNDYPAYAVQERNLRHPPQKEIEHLPFEGTRKGDYPAHEITQRNLRHPKEKPITPLPFEGQRKGDYPAYDVTQRNLRHHPDKPITPLPFEGTRKNDYPGTYAGKPDKAHPTDQLPTGGKFEGKPNDYPAYEITQRNLRHHQEKPITPLPFEGTRKGDYPAYEITQRNMRHPKEKPITPLPFEGERKGDYPAYEITQRNLRHPKEKPITPLPFEGERKGDYPAYDNYQVQPRHAPLPPMQPTLPLDGTTTNAAAFKGWQLPPRRPALGVQMINDKAYILIPANAPLPAMGRQTFTTVRDNQSTISVLVLEGDFQVASKCSVLGQFDLEGIPPAAEGVPRIQVTFMVSKEGVLTCHAMDLDTKRHEQWLAKGKFTVTPSPGNSGAGSKPLSPMPMSR